MLALSKSIGHQDFYPPHINTSRDFSPIFPTNTGSEGLVVEDSQKGWLKETQTCFFDGGQFTLVFKAK